jgi:hypothetical protein
MSLAEHLSEHGELGVASAFDAKRFHVCSLPQSQATSTEGRFLPALKGGLSAARQGFRAGCLMNCTVRGLAC